MTRGITGRAPVNPDSFSVSSPEPAPGSTSRPTPGEPSGTVELPFLTDQGALLGQNHLVDGNPVRFAQGPLALRADDEWRTKMRPGHRRTVTALTLPFLAGYHYPLR